MGTRSDAIDGSQPMRQVMRKAGSVMTNISLPGLERSVAQDLVDAAHQTCPYSKAVRGNVDVVLNLVS